MRFSRRWVLRFGVPAAATAAATIGHPTFASAATPSSATWVSAPDLGIKPTNSAADNRTALIAALNGTAACIVFPAGDYAIDNGTTDITIANFSGNLAMLPEARFVFADNTARGMIFKGGTGARFYGLATAFATTPPNRVTAHECLTFATTTDTYLENSTINGSAAAGLLFSGCVRPVVVGATIANTMADGLNFTNCQDSRADHITTTDTGDDAVSFGSVATGQPYTGGLATNLSITRSKSRGIAITGQSNVTIRDAVIDTTVGHGFYCAYESAWNTRVPTDVRFERVRVTNGGAWTAAAGGGTNSGMRINAAGTVAASQITVDSPGQHGIFVTATNQSTLTDLMVTNAPGSGVNFQSGRHLVDRLTVSETNGIGLSATNCQSLEFGTITLQNVARTHSTHWAFDVENAPYVFGSRLWISDNHAPAAGYIVRASGTQKGSLGTVIGTITNGRLTFDNSSNLSYTTM
jgi:hypothetical protein